MATTITRGQNPAVCWIRRRPPRNPWYERPPRQREGRTLPTVAYASLPPRPRKPSGRVWYHQGQNPSHRWVWMTKIAPNAQHRHATMGGEHEGGRDDVEAWSSTMSKKHERGGRAIHNDTLWIALRLELEANAKGGQPHVVGSLMLRFSTRSR
jgi:hypothetical protein